MSFWKNFIFSDDPEESKKSIVAGFTDINPTGFCSWSSLLEEIVKEKI